MNDNYNPNVDTEVAFIPEEKCLYSWGFQWDPNDFSDLYECQLEKGHKGPHRDREEVFDSEEEDSNE